MQQNNRFEANGQTLHITRFDEDHEDLWEDDPEAPGCFRRSAIPQPTVLGSVCCDLWDVTFASPDVIVDVMMKGAARIQANGGKTERGEIVQNPITSREDARARLCAYVIENDVATLAVPTRATLYLHMATGASVHRFAATIKSTKAATSPWLEDYFIISPEPLPLDPDLVEDASWIQPVHPRA